MLKTILNLGLVRKHHLTSLFIPIFLIALTSCRKDKPNAEDITHSYLHLSHTRLADNSGMYAPVYDIDYSQYELLLLGGDLANLTSLDDDILTHVDAVFDLGAPTTLLALGNHDYTDTEKLSNYTNRPNYFAYYQNYATFIVLDTQDSLSNIVGDQQSFLNEVLDTIQVSRQVFILTHKLIWMDGNSELEPQIDFISNGIAGDCFHCVNPNNFYTAVYPKLISLENSGINVTCLAGDLGFKVSSFQYSSPEGIDFYASGVDYDQPETWNQVLIIDHNITQHKVDCRFVSISEL
ncbi:MAG: metallophosphoesterase [Crocinitomicaceae bacterium]|nr:metallophosphoesterase [Crocinitomicaceae bacterium]